MWIRYVYLFYFVPNKNLEHFIDLKLSVMYISVTNFWFIPTLWSFEDIYIFPMNLDIDILLWTLSEHFLRFVERKRGEEKFNKQFSLNLTEISETSTVAFLTIYLINLSCA